MDATTMLSGASHTQRRIKLYQATTDTHKHCRQCDTFLEHAAFGKNSNNPLGLHSECRGCARERASAHRSKRAAEETEAERWRRVRKQQVRTTYGIELEDAEALLQAQGGACRICGTTEFERSWHIDHCHATGAVRSILCSECNLGLGKFLDSPELLRAAIDYLEEHS